MTRSDVEQIKFLDLIMIAIGCMIFAFSLVLFNIRNKLADGGISGITLILKAVFKLNPAYTTLLLNGPLILIGYRYLGKKALIYTIYGTLMLSVWLWVWQQVKFSIDYNHDLLLAAISAGLTGGLGQGIVYRFGGTTGGTDIIAKMIHHFKGTPIGHTLFGLDLIILTFSLVYIDSRHMAYTLIYSFTLSKVVNLITEGPYEASGSFIISNQNSKIVNLVMKKMNRGSTIFEAEGGYSHKSSRVLFFVVSARELNELKKIVLSLDPAAFIVSFHVNEVVGEGFTYKRPNFLSRIKTGKKSPNFFLNKKNKSN